MNKLILNTNTKFDEAIQLLDANGNGVLPVVDSNNKFIGLITDGDIRKAIMNRNLDLEHIINKKPYKLNILSTKDQIINYLKKIHRRHIPLVDESNHFIRMFTLDDINFNLKTNWVIIMAGGLGTRLGELTKNIPKPMLVVGNKPMLKHIIDRFVAYGFTKFMLSVNYKSEVIKEYFQDGSEFGIEIIYLEETKKLGTGGALSLIDIHLTEPFFVINGDVLSSMNYEELLDFHSNAKSDATMCIRENSYQVPYGVINIDNDHNIINIIEKPINKFYINTGIYVLNSEVLSYIPKNEYFELPSLFEILQKDNKQIKSFKINDYWIDMGKPSDYEKINLDLQVL